MRSNRVSSEAPSTLVRLFVERAVVDAAHTTAEQVMADIVERVREKGTRNRERQLQQFLKDRQVRSIDVVPDLNCDGMIEPIGPTFNDGFRIRLKRNVSSARTRFTVAHEACHTFFYEQVPELKFGPHTTDDEEERLCNLGAAILLIPARSLRADARKMPTCLESLGQLARRYDVSSATMLLRLRAMGLWKCQLS